MNLRRSAKKKWFSFAMVAVTVLVLLFRMQAFYLKRLAFQWVTLAETASYSAFIEQAEDLQGLGIETEIYRLENKAWELSSRTPATHLTEHPLQIPPLEGEYFEKDKASTGYVMTYYLGVDRQLLLVRRWLPSILLQNFVQQYWEMSLGILALFLLSFYALYLFFSRSILKNITELERTLKQDGPPKKLYSSYPALNQLGQTVYRLNKHYTQQAQRAQANEEKLALLVEHLNLGVILIEKHKVQLYNSAAIHLLGWKQSVHTKAYETVIPSTALIEHIQRTIEKGLPWRGEVDIFIPQAKNLDVTLVPFKANEGEWPGSVLVLLYDMTHIHYLEKVRSDFVSNASHELRTPITAIKGFCESLLEADFEDQAMMQYFIEIINQESNRLEALVNDILQLSKVEAGYDAAREEQLALDEVVTSIVPLFRAKMEAKHLQLEVKMPQEPITIKIYRAGLEQVLINLLDNAYKYSEPHGNIRLWVRKEASDILFEVQDEGIGIPPEDLGRIFERFYRVDKARSRQTGGTGLGLSIVRHTVEQMGGRIQVKSQLNEGTSFLVSFPYKQT